MMLLRTLVLERAGEDAPLNGALLCGFAVPQITSNFLVYSLDEETEPGNARVYVAALRKKLERYFLSGVGAQEELQIAMQVFKQILMLAAAGAKPVSAADTQIPYHFVDLKGCKLPPARPEDHHSVIIKKALVMKVITLGASAPASAAIESATLIVPSIRFSSQMVSPPKVVKPQAETQLPLLEQLAEPQKLSPVASAVEETEPFAFPLNEPPILDAPTEHTSLFEVDSTLTSLARVAQELTAQKTAVLEQQEALDKWQSQLQRGQAQLDQERQELVNRTLEKEATLQLRAQVLESREAQLAGAFTTQLQEQERMNELASALEKRVAQAYSQELMVRQRSEKLAAMLALLSGGRQNLQAMLLEFDQALEGLGKRDDYVIPGS
ncbi:MAG: hypothetical protein CFE47_16655 [Pseudomonas sp. PGPPP1]|uniref:hypothetical protein n=1 Tax=Pseudomonas TaxID=286 RepID=UPI000BCA38AC|nr:MULTISPECIES: hypothetical protein [Pseudomonas]OYU06363.1 MAG: hypothetical protein CFE47_16655 [Pseudomonas sp. PGPPP1]